MFNICFWKMCTPNKPRTYAYISIPWNIQAKGKEARLGLEIFNFFKIFFLLKASLVEKAEGQNSASNILTYTGETQGTQKGTALLSKVWGYCHCQVSKAAKGSSVEMPALVGTPGTVKDCKYAKPHTCTMNAQKVGTWLTSSFKRN